jgi:hypothetical protein
MNLKSQYKRLKADKSIIIDLYKEVIRCAILVNIYAHY